MHLFLCLLCCYGYDIAHFCFRVVHALVSLFAVLLWIRHWSFFSVRSICSFLLLSDIKEVLKILIHQSGVFGLWKGVFPTLLRDVPFSAIYWMNYEMLKSLYGSGIPSFTFSFLAGAISGGVSSFTHFYITIANYILRYYLTLNNQQLFLCNVVYH